jgi:hypothetical protein
MIFKRKKKHDIKCEICNSKVNDKYSFCPYCGSSLIDEEAELKEFGMLGKNDISKDELEKDQFSQQGFGITDKLISSLVNSLAKNLDKQFKSIDKDFAKQMNNAQIKSFPNGIKIRIGPPQTKTEKNKSNNVITSEQIERMSTLPRSTAKTNVRRLSNKVVYELNTPGIESPQDVFVSKTESGYEIKAIGSSKVYVNNLQIDLPMKGFSVSENKLLVEFKTEE